MSLILDALRKSEAERRRGKAPDLFANLPTATAAHGQTPLRRWLWLGGSILLVGAAFAFWTSVHDDPRRETAATPDDDSKDDARLGQQSGTLPTKALPVTNPPIGAKAPGSAVVAPPTAANEPTRPPASAAATASPPPPPMAAEPAAAAPPASTAPEAETLPPIAVLAASERALLPALKLSMHVWDSVPEKRFAIIDGQRVREGSVLGNSFIEEIRHDGVVLNIDGRRILLPRP